ncbi:hypothetical protein V502_10926 [Pseudogymnoascus sp. VKM F-4520 (FW-2644)]|nr:hypothetical protein V502_10926 [Pseudogymnoascus sp. VKM F-4520 (FW-2644)]
MLGNGSTCHRHNNTEGSARDIVSNLAGHKTPITTDLQRQLVDENKSLDQTSAEIELQSEMKEKTRWAREKKEIEQQMHVAIQKHDREAEEMMREERDRYTKMVKKVENDTGTLRSTMNNLLAERDKRVARMEKQMEEQQAAHKAELERFSERQRRIEKEKEELKMPARRRYKSGTPWGRREQEKQEEQRQREKEEQEKARQKQRQVLAPTPEFSLFALTIASGLSYALGPLRLRGRESYTQLPLRTNFSTSAGIYSLQMNKSAPLAAVSLGDIINGARVSITAYGNGIWETSVRLHQQYPDLAAGLNERGLNNLALFSLGPENTFYARWRNGSYLCPLGYRRSYVLSSRSSEGLSSAVDFNLNGYYPGLSECLIKNHLWMNIAAIALDMSNGTDYLMVYWLGMDATKVFFLWHTSYGNLISGVNSWWQAQGLGKNV